jgi:hypothetical protein
MAITKYNLYDSRSAANCDALCLAFLREALIPDWLGGNGTVTKPSDKKKYELRDGDGNLIAIIGNYAGVGNTVTDTYFFVDSTHYVGHSANSYVRLTTGYKTSKGAMIIASYTSGSGGTNAGILIFGKTNNGKLAMVLKDPSKCYTNTSYGTPYNGSAATAYGAVTGARDDDISALTHGLTFGPMDTGFGSSASSDENQTVLCPTPTHSNSGETSIIEGVFMMPWAQYRNEGKIQIGDKYYATNGYWALED